MEENTTISQETGQENPSFDYLEDEMLDEDTQQMLRMVFVKYNQTKFSEIKNAVDSGDIRLAHRLVHILKANAGQVGKYELFKIAEKIEALLKDDILPIPDDAMSVLERELTLALEDFRPFFDEAAENVLSDNAEKAQDTSIHEDNETKSTIMIIDDNASNIKVLSRILSSEYSVFDATSGQEAIAAVIEQLPDLVLLEVFMSEMDGYATIEALKNNEKTKDIPVVFITGVDDACAEEKALSLGAADYIVKPFSPAVVKLRVGNHVHIGKLRREVESALVASRSVSRAKSDFLAKMSNGLQALMNAEFLRNIGHELKTSLTRIHTSITNAADLIDYGMDKDEMLESLEDAGQEIMKMADLINSEISRYAGEGEH